MSNFRKFAALAALASLWAGMACAQPVSREAVVTHYASIVEASYGDTITAAKAMQRAINAFVARPAPSTLEAARKSWLAAREWYGQTEAYRFYGGPIDDA